MTPTAMAERQTAFDLQIAYDDGAGYGKWRAVTMRDTDHHPAASVMTQKIVALAALNTYDDYGVDGAPGDDPPILVQAPAPWGAAGSYDQAVVYAVGASVLRKGTARFDTSHGRYTGETARLRFYGGLSRVLAHFGLNHAVIHLTIGLNTERYRDLQPIVKAFYMGEHHFRAGGVEYHVQVPVVVAAAQAWAAAKAVRVNPPAALHPLLATYPLDESTTLVLDGGNFSLDVTVLEPHESRPGLLVPHTMFAVTVGVNDIRQQLEEYVTAQLGTRPPLRVIERAMNPASGRSYGTVPNQQTGGVLDISSQLSAIRRSVWDNAWTQVRAQLRGVNARYIILVGGLGIVCADEIAATTLGRPHSTQERELTLGDLPGFVNAASEWAVVEGLSVIGADDVNRRTHEEGEPTGG